LAYLRLRQGHSTTEALAAADRLLQDATVAGDTVRALARWAALIRALDDLQQGALDRAATGCSDLVSADPQVAAWAWSCLGRAHRAQRQFEDATAAFRQSLLQHELADFSDSGEGLAGSAGLLPALPLGPGQRAQTFARAARTAVDVGNAERAWEILQDLDRRSAHDGERRRCRQQARTPQLAARWREIDDQRAQQLAELTELEVPAAGARRRELEIRRRQVRQALRELWWQWPGCESMAPSAEDGVDLRAFAIDDEILLLRRDANGIHLEHRTAMLRATRRELLRQIAHRLDGVARPEWSAEAWRELLQPLAAALLPRDLATLGPVTRFALHGALQGIPPAALPVAGNGSALWLSSLTTPVVVPAGATPRDAGLASTPDAARSPLFVVDPRGDLPGARKLASTYRELFPEARLMGGDEASHQALRQALATAAWLHVDSHGLYDPVLPELSGLVMADRPLRLMELADLDLPQRFVNLSGCRTGRWPITADSGRYGLGGLLVHAGAQWVVASRN
ncbi:MAG: CHAT domain-containing protein, partial [Acidobacteriota bacterium]